MELLSFVKSKSACDNLVTFTVLEMLPTMTWVAYNFIAAEVGLRRDLGDRQWKRTKENHKINMSLITRHECHMGFYQSKIGNETHIYIKFYSKWR